MFSNICKINIVHIAELQIFLTVVFIMCYIFLYYFSKYVTAIMDSNACYYIIFS